MGAKYPPAVPIKIVTRPWMVLMLEIHNQIFAGFHPIFRIRYTLGFD